MERDSLRADLRWNLLFVPSAVSAPLDAHVSTAPLAGRTGSEVWEVVENLVAILFLRAAALCFVGLGALALCDWALPGDAREFGYAAALALMIWTPAQLLCLGTIASIVKRTRSRNRPLTTADLAYKAIQAAPLSAVFGAIAFAAVLHY